MERRKVVKDVMATQHLEGHYLTVRVVPAGCSGLGYDLNLVKDTKAGDLIWEQDGVMIATDAMSVADAARTPARRFASHKAASRRWV